MFMKKFARKTTITTMFIRLIMNNLFKTHKKSDE